MHERPAAMSPTHTRRGTKRYRYYVSQAVLQRGRDACPVGRVPAAAIERAVIEQLCAIFRQPEIIVGTWHAARGQVDDITETEAREALLALTLLWDEFFPAEQARLVRRTSLAELAEVEKIEKSYLSRVLRLTLIAPDIVEASVAPLLSRFVIAKKLPVLAAGARPP